MLCSEETYDWKSRLHTSVGQNCNALLETSKPACFPSPFPVPTCTPSPETKIPTKSKEVAIVEDSLVAAHTSIAAAAAGCGLCDDSNDSIK